MELTLLQRSILRWLADKRATPTRRGPVAVPTVYVQRPWENPTAAFSPHLIGQPSSFRTLPRFFLILHDVSVGSQVEAAPPVSVRRDNRFTPLPIDNAVVRLVNI
ncbi:hypothetical protein HDV64DRAFT_235795 [Trichoderma sp. TUCIM 5745]